MVLFMALAFLNLGLAGEHKRFGDFLSDNSTRNGLRHYLLLGQPHDYGRP